MRLPHTLQPFVLLASAVLPSAYAFGFAGHAIIATIAQIHLHPSVLPILCDLLQVNPSDDSEATLRRQCHLAQIASWADHNRDSVPWSKKMHYVNAVDDHPGSNCQYPGPRGWKGEKDQNVLDAFKNVTRILGEWSGVSEHEVGVKAASSQTKAIGHLGPLQEEAFKFLVHFVGDMHQPLHLTGHYGGGNGQQAVFGGKQSNLHGVWDGDILHRLIESVNSTYSQPLPDRGNYLIPSQQIEDALGEPTYRPLIRRVMWEGIESLWIDDIQSWLSCPVPAPTPENTSLLSLATSTLSNPLALPQKLLNALGGRQKVDIQPDGPVLCPYAWTAPLHKLNCLYVWNFPTIPSPSGKKQTIAILHAPQYLDALDKDLVMEKLLAQGGLRLAYVLNWLFAKDLP